MSEGSGADGLDDGLAWSTAHHTTHRTQACHTHPLNGPFSGTTQVSRHHKGKTNLDLTGARDSEWQRHLLGHMQVCTLLQTDNNASTPLLSFLQAGCPSCRPTNSVKALKAMRRHVLTALSLRSPNVLAALVTREQVHQKPLYNGRLQSYPANTAILYGFRTVRQSNRIRPH